VKLVVRWSMPDTRPDDPVTAKSKKCLRVDLLEKKKFLFCQISISTSTTIADPFYLTINIPGTFKISVLVGFSLKQIRWIWCPRRPIAMPPIVQGQALNKFFKRKNQFLTFVRGCNDVEAACLLGTAATRRDWRILFLQAFWTWKVFKSSPINLYDRGSVFMS